MLQINLTGRVALVTGGARGIGLGITRVLAAAGATVAINYWGSQEAAEALVREIETAGRQAMAVGADAGREAEVREMVSQVLERFGRIDVLVNNAGITSVRPFPQLDLSSWNEIINVNLHGVYNCCAAVVPSMFERRSGRIINISSTAAITGGGGGAHYAASKGAVNGLTRALARELAPRGILVNAVAPTVITSDFLLGRYPGEKDRQALVRDIPVGRVGQPEDVGYMVAFLASDLAGYISGQVIILDGGRTFK